MKVMKIQLPGKEFQFIFLGVTLAASFLLIGCGKVKEEEKKPETPTVSVKVAKAEKTTISARVSAIGTISPKQQATLGARISAPLQKIDILKNRRVKAGDVLAILESRDLQAQKAEAQSALQEARLTLQGLNKGAIPQSIAQAEKDVRDAIANRDNAQLTLERRKVLFAQNGISKKDLEASELAYTTSDNQLQLAQSSLKLRQSTLNPNDRAIAENRVKAAEEHLATIETQLAYAIIRAPFSGVITDQFQFQGEYAAAGAKILNIADTTEVIVKAPFPDTVAQQIKPGEAAQVTPSESPDEKYSGKVSLISPASDPANRSVEIWVRLTNPRGKLRAGGAAEVSFPTQTVKDAIVVPVSAVTLDASNAGKGSLMVVDSKMIAHETRVTIGVRTGDRVQITSGLKGDETVVVEGGYALPDGSHVQVAKEDEAEKPEAGEAEKRDDEKPKGEDKKAAEPAAKEGKH